MVERGLPPELRCSMAIAGESPSMKSTSGFCIWSRNCRAYAERLSTYLRWPSAYRVSNASEDFPDPLMPVITTSFSRGISSVRFLRLCWRAPVILIVWAAIFSPRLKTDQQITTRLPSPEVIAIMSDQTIPFEMTREELQAMHEKFREIKHNINNTLAVIMAL